LIVSQFTFGQSTPLATIPAGDSPFSLSLTEDGHQAVVVNLFPTQSDDSNVRVLDLAMKQEERAFRAGTRLVAIAIKGSIALVVNEDQDVIRMIDITSGVEIAQIPVGSRPSNIIAIPNSNRAIATNGTSGDISFIDIDQREVIGEPIFVGSDPRSVAIHGRYAYIALGGENKLAVVDLEAPTPVLVNKVSVGKNPVAVVVADNGNILLTANLTNNTVTALDNSNPAAPVAISQIPVGVGPTSLALNPTNQKLVYVANISSDFFTVLDLNNVANPQLAVAGVVDINGPSSGILVNSTGTELYVIEFKSLANLLVYDPKSLELTAKPATDIPGEPRISPFITSTGNCSDSFFIVEAGLAESQPQGFWGMEVSISEGLLTGGFNLGGGFEADGLSPGFGAFSIASRQSVDITVTAQSLGEAQLEVSLLKDNKTLITSSTGEAPLNLSSGDLEPGFYVVTIKSVPGSPAGVFQMALAAEAFAGGVVVGGHIFEGATGFGAFCVPVSQVVDVSLLGGSEYGAAGAGDLVVTMLNSEREVIRSLNNSIATSASVSPPEQQAIDVGIIDFYVDAAVEAGGNGSSASPFRSITAAVEAARSGGVIFVRPGLYSPSTTQEKIPIGSAGIGLHGFSANTKLIGTGASTTVIDAENDVSGTNGNAVVIPVNNVTFSGFTVKNAAEVGVFVFDGDNVLIENNLLTSNTRFGIGASLSSGLIIRNNVTSANLESGIAVSTALPMTITNPPNNCPTSPAGAYGAYIINNISNDNQADGVLVSQGGNYCIADNTTNTNGSSGIELNNRDDGAGVPLLNGVVVNNQLIGNGGVQFGFAGTGILVTENNARADIISGNSLQNNRPFGIGIFLEAHAGTIDGNTVLDTQNQGILVALRSSVDTISNNIVRNSGLSGYFIDRTGAVDLVSGNEAVGNGTGLSILNGSSAGTVSNNFFDNNGVGMEIAAGDDTLPGASASIVTLNSFNGNQNGGILVRQQSSVGDFLENQVLNNRSIGVQISDSNVAITNSTISGNTAAGLSLFNSAMVAVDSSTIRNNGIEGGIFANGGSTASITNTVIDGNRGAGVVAGEALTLFTFGAGNSVINTDGYGLNAQNGASINCNALVVFSDNSSGNTIGNVNNCN